MHTQTKKPNILMIVSDQHNYKVSGFSGDTIVSTPTLDSLASEGTVFEKTYCQSPACTPSRASFLTGKNYHNVRCWANHRVLFPEHKTIADYLHEAGYETCCVGKMHYGGKDQFHGFKNRPYGDFWHGLAHQEDPIDMFPNMGGVIHAGPSQIPESLQQEHIVSTEAGSFIREHVSNNPEKPWFVLASYCKPHAPLVVPSRYLHKYLGKVPSAMLEPQDLAALEAAPVMQRKAYGLENITKDQVDKARAAYWGAVEYLDDQIEHVLFELKKSGEFDNTIILYFSDHGDMIGNHGLWWKANYYEESVRVPLIIKGPGVGKNVRINQLTALIDILPTICDLCGIAVPNDIDGVTLKPLLHEEKTNYIPHDTVISEYMGAAQKEIELPGSIRMITDGRYKLAQVYGERDLLFDLKNDPKEFCNTAHSPEYSDIASRLRKKLNEKYDFDDLFKMIEFDTERAKEFRSNIRPSCPNQYMLKDGRIFNAEESMYNVRWLKTENLSFSGHIPQRYH